MFVVSLIFHVQLEVTSLFHNLLFVLKINISFTKKLKTTA